MISFASIQLPPPPPPPPLRHHHSTLVSAHLHKTTMYQPDRFRFFPHVSSISSNARPVHSSGSSLASVAPLEAILFDIDGTLCDSDPLHFYAFRDMLQEIGFNGGTPITEEFFIKNISGSRKFLEDKEALFRRLASEQLQPMKGLQKLCKWIEDCGLRRAAVTNAPRSNAELLISMLGLSDFFESLVLASECDRVKPFPDPYLKALQELGISHHHAFVFEDSVSGIKAGTGAGMPVVGLGTRNPEQLLTEAGAVFVIEDFDDPKLWTELEELKIKAEVTTTTEL
ncbi:HALOACID DEHALOGENASE-LIKE HYDROLASE DOMAIN-CONTAINING PROTEIN SGPP [Salix viminalis]|uniref:HALOACID DEHALOGENASE-LIKE HYDROLASE DOMAIN-CONTAINING PROTEIN SGPP n=1 Tax=Salix viminalis TaxID=40686 RepID=A0A9Q0NTQ4_SALVM|nr:HALOACID DEHALOGENASE-LIKE HYDROLASE DOMAIN-CONTAINING PROTEIN SGPP [Salix viminalis]